MSNELSGIALREAVARALGWALLTNNCTSGMEHVTDRHWHAPDGLPAYVPAFDSSLDACFAPGGPVEAMRKMPAYKHGEALSRLPGIGYDHAAGMGLSQTADRAWPLFLTAEDYCRAFLAAAQPPQTSITSHEGEIR